MVHITKEIQQRIHRMVEELKQKGQLRSPQVEAAFLSIPRHLFINRLPSYLTPEGKDWMTIDPFHPQEEILDKIYSASTAIVLKGAPNPTSSSAPNVMAPMLEALELTKGMKVLEIGAGSGYNAALMAHIIGKDKNDLVYTIDNQPDVAKEAEENLKRASFEGIKVICADGGYGYKERAPYHRVIITASIYDIPNSWREQLMEGGIVVAPLWMAPDWNPIVKLVKKGETLSGQFVGGAGFMPLKGYYGYDEYKLGRRINADIEEGLIKLLENPIEENIEFPIHIQFKDESHRYQRLMDFNVFVNLKEEHAAALDAPSRKKYSYLSLLNREIPSLVSAWMPDWKVGIYGSEAMYTRLLELMKQWEEVGAPEISSYKVGVSPGRIDPIEKVEKEENTFIRFRLWNTYAVSITTALLS